MHQLQIGKSVTVCLAYFTTASLSETRRYSVTRRFAASNSTERNVLSTQTNVSADDSCVPCARSAYKHTAPSTTDYLSTGLTTSVHQWQLKRVMGW